MNILVSTSSNLWCVSFHLQKFQSLYLGAKAAGVIPLAHRSGGPLSDIVVPFEGQHTGLFPLLGLNSL